MAQTILVDDITMWKHKFLTPDHKVKLGNFVGEHKSDTPRFCSNISELSVKSILKYEENKCLQSKHIPNDEIKRHNRDGDMWAIFDGRVYNISSYLSRHPELLTGFIECNGKDAKSIFAKAQPNKKVSVFFKAELIGEVK